MSEATRSPSSAPLGREAWSKHRVEALTDGIFAVAMTLLVIELKLPEPHAIHSEVDLHQALATLAPKAASWVISFFVLAIFWISHHRIFHYVRLVDAGLLWRNIFQLAFVSLMPFSSALVGEFGIATTSQVAYNGNMILLGLFGLAKAQYIRKHPELTSQPLDDGTYHAMLVRIGGLAALGGVAIVIALLHGPLFSTYVYLLMIPIGRYGRFIKARADARLPTGATPSTTHRSS